MEFSEEMRAEIELEKVRRAPLVALWDMEFRTYATSDNDGETPQPGETVTDVWVETPRYGGIAIVCETSAGRILSPWYDSDPRTFEDEPDCEGWPTDMEVAQDQPDEYLHMMYGATEFTNWLENSQPSVGQLRHWGS